MISSSIFLFQLLNDPQFSLGTFLSGLLLPGMIIGYTVAVSKAGIIGIILAQIIAFFGLIYFFIRIIVQLGFIFISLIKRTIFSNFYPSRPQAHMAVGLENPEEYQFPWGFCFLSYEYHLTEARTYKTYTDR
jgi:hypothetical protein